MAGAIYLLGSGGHGSDVLNVLQRCDLLGDVAGCFDDHPEPARLSRWGVAHLGSLTGARLGAGRFVLGVGLPRTKSAVLAAVELGAAVPLTLVDPAAMIGHGVELGPGTVVFPGGCVSALASVGQHGLIHHNAVIGHDTALGARCSVMPGATVSGDCLLGDDVLVGTNAAVRQGVTIGDGAQIGAGTVVITDVPPGTTVVGVPARPR